MAVLGESNDKVFTGCLGSGFLGGDTTGSVLFDFSANGNLVGIGLSGIEIFVGSLCRLDS